MNIENRVNQPNKKKLLKDVRKQLNLTQTEFAEAINWDRRDLSNLETGKKIPIWIIRAKKLNDLLEQAGYSLSDLSLPEDQNQLNLKNGNS